MTEQVTIQTSQISFKDFIWNNRRYRIILSVASIAIVIQFAIFKYFYPYADFIHDDSFGYLLAAYHNYNVNTHLIGYSRFLRLFSVFTSSDIALAIFQYLFIQSSALFFLFTLFYFYRPGKIVQIILLSFLVMNPLFLYLANLVSSDAIFLALSFLWFSLLLFIIYQPTTRIIVLHTLVLFMAFTVRYNALIYPFIATLAFAVSRLSLYKKIAGIAAGFIVCSLFILYTGQKYKALTGTWQYSPFSGWQLANNAMYTYRYVDSADRKPVPEKFKVLDNMIRTYFDTANGRKYYYEVLMASTFYMWHRKLPLYKYRDLVFKKDSAASDLKQWASMGPLYKEYGIYIIKQYPQHFLTYFLWPNTIKYFTPPGEFLETYNGGKDTIQYVAQVWFEYKNNKVSTRLKDYNITALDFYPIFTGIMNGVFICCLLCFIMLKEFWRKLILPKGVLIAGTFWLLNAGFTIFSTAAALRFLSFPILLMSTFVLLLIDWLLRLAKSGKGEVENSLKLDSSTIVGIITALLVVLFLYTGISKLADYRVFKEQIATTSLLAPIARYVASLLPFIEIMVALLLIIPRSRLMGLFISLILMIIFTGYIILILNSNETIPCSCGGVLEELSWKQHIVFNSIFIALSLAGAILEKRINNLKPDALSFKKEKLIIEKN